jgi:sugar phosphate permease
LLCHRHSRSHNTSQYGYRQFVGVIGAAGLFCSLVRALRDKGGGPNVPLLFCALFCVHFFNNALITLTVGPICAESAPVHLVGAASGIIIATGEFIGGGVAPIRAGWVVETFGIRHILWLPIVALIVGFLLSLTLKEARPQSGCPVLE